MKINSAESIESQVEYQHSTEMQAEILEHDSGTPEFAIPVAVRYLNPDHPITKAEKLAAARRFYYLAPAGLTDVELAKALDVDRVTGYRYRKELRATEVSWGRYTLKPSKEEVEWAMMVLQRANNVVPQQGANTCLINIFYSVQVVADK